MAQEGDPALGRVLEFCRNDPDAAVRRRFFAPLEPVSGDPALSPPSRSYAPARLLDALWDWLGDTLDPELACDARTVVLGTLSQEPAGQLDALRRRAADRIEAGLAQTDEDPRAEKRLRARLGVDDFSTVRHVVSLLRCASVLRQAVEGLPPTITDMNETLAVKLRDRYEAAAEVDPDAGVWALFVIMTRFEHPWRLLRVFERIARREDDLLVSQTDMSHIGEALLADAAFHVDRFAAPPQDPEQAIKAAEALTAFSAITIGMTREIGIRKDGPWGKRLFALRGRASEQMSAIHDAARDVIVRAVPEGAGAKARGGARSGEDLPRRAEALCLFMQLTKEDASRAAVGGAHASVLSFMTERLETAGQGLLAQLRGGGADCDAVLRRAEEIAALMRALGEGDAASVLLRRTAAARAA